MRNYSLLIVVFFFFLAGTCGAQTNFQILNEETRLLVSVNLKAPGFSLHITEVVEHVLLDGKRELYVLATVCESEPREGLVRQATLYLPLPKVEKITYVVFDPLDAVVKEAAPDGSLPTPMVVKYLNEVSKFADVWKALDRTDESNVTLWEAKKGTIQFTLDNWPNQEKVTCVGTLSRNTRWFSLDFNPRPGYQPKVTLGFDLFTEEREIDIRRDPSELSFYRVSLENGVAFGKRYEWSGRSHSASYVGLKREQVKALFDLVYEVRLYIRRHRTALLEGRDIALSLPDQISERLEKLNLMSPDVFISK